MHRKLCYSDVARADVERLCGDKSDGRAARQIRIRIKILHFYAAVGKYFFDCGRGERIRRIVDVMFDGYAAAEFGFCYGVAFFGMSGVDGMGIVYGQQQGFVGCIFEVAFARRRINFLYQICTICAAGRRSCAAARFFAVETDTDIYSLGFCRADGL